MMIGECQSGSVETGLVEGELQLVLVGGVGANGAGRGPIKINREVEDKDGTHNDERDGGEPSRIKGENQNERKDRLSSIPVGLAKQKSQKAAIEIIGGHVNSHYQA